MYIFRIFTEKHASRVRCESAACALYDFEKAGSRFHDFADLEHGGAG